MASTSDEHPDGPDPIRDRVWESTIIAMAGEAELAFDRPAPRFGEIQTDTKLDAVVARQDDEKN